MFTSGIKKLGSRKRLLVQGLIALLVISLPVILKAQPVGANMTNPVVIGNYGEGTYNYSDTKNNSTSNGYINDIGQASDDIYYKVIVQGVSTISISLCASGFDTYLHLLNSTGAVIVSNDDKGPLCGAGSVQSSIQTTIGPGTYYIVTEGYGSTTGNLILSVNNVVQPSRNFIRVWDAAAPETNPNTLITREVREVKQVTQYFDGLGRPEQVVVKKGSLSGSVYADMVSPVVYDNFGKEVQKYLPYVSPSSHGFYKTNTLTEQNAFYVGASSPITGQGETFFYGKTDIEPSPLNRPTKTYAPGNNWVGSSRGTEIKYCINTPTDAVRIWTVTPGAIGSFSTYTSQTSPINAVYPAGELYKNITVDETGKQVIEFKDKEGKVILKKVQLTAAADDGITGSGYTGWLCTYYLYDDLNNLRCVIQPKGVELISSNWILSNTTILAEQCFRYEYDAKNRMIMKKVPGAGEVYMVYDNRDRMVATSTAVGRAGLYTGYCSWIFTLYDELNRPVATGDMGTCLDLTGMINYVNGLNNGNVTFTSQPGPATSVVAYNPIVGNAICTSCSNWYMNTITHYDDYAGLPAGLSDFLTTWNSNFNATNNISWPYSQMPQKSTATKGMATWSMSRELSSNTFLNTVNYYDEKGRPIQVQTQNITGGIDISTTQYSWSGQPLISVSSQQIVGTNAQTTVVVSQLTYDDLGRLIKTEKKLSNTFVNSNTMSAYKTTSQLEYDALGQMKKKKIGNKPGAPAGTPLANLDFEYNIRGWLLSINKGYVDAGTNADQYFGMQLGYDKNGSLGTFVPQYNGNISGTIWKAEGDQEKRKYDFTYDPVNRLKTADFNQYASGSGTGAVFNKAALMDFSVENLTYDANGNILSMWQKGWKINNSDYIDKLTYNYKTNSNQLLNVIDLVNDPATKLGDFRASALYQSETPTKNSATIDYTYDPNGNLVKDKNKDIYTRSGGDVIKYNYLNLPTYIGFRGTGNTTSGTISYLYDALGNKLKKITTEFRTSKSGSIITTTTTTIYINGGVYESKSTSPADPNNSDYANVLQLLGQEEGRIRFKPLVAATPASFQYDYFIKDHLGNVRTVLTEELQTNIYPAATLEGTYDVSTNSMVNYEKVFYNINSNYIVPETSIASWISPAESVANTKLYYNNNQSPASNAAPVSPPNLSYPASCTPIQTDGSAKLYKLNATSNKTGLEFMIKVMAGDKIDIFGKSYYLNSTNITNANSTPLDLLSLMTNLLLSPGNIAKSKGISSSQLSGLNGNIPGTFFRGGNNESITTVPKAYINYIFLDEQFKYAGGNFSRVGASGTVKDHWTIDATALQNISVPKNGYIFVYVSNESNFDVFFDNLQVIHKPGAILEETHYYPFGLTMSGISSKAAGKPEGNKKFQGQDFAHKEFSDGSGLEMYEFKWRMDDPQTGRFWQIDPLADKYVYNSTYAFSENKVINGVELEGLEVVLVNAKTDPAIYNAGIKEKDKSAIHIFAHANPSSILGRNGFIKSPKQFDKMLSQENDTWKNRKPNEHLTVVLHACRTGRDGYDGGGKYESAPKSFANRMSEAFPNVTFIAPDERDAFSAEVGKPETAREIGPRKLINGKPNSDPVETDKEGNALPYEKLHATGDEQGSWKVFNKGVVTEEYDGDWKPTANPGILDNIFHKK
ncbi:MAG: DUF6443 domain-containing protein [Ferruginibacter sp.]